MLEPKKTTDELIQSLYAFVKGEFKYMHEKFDHIDQKFDHVDKRFDDVDKRFDKVEGLMGGNDGRISRLEDSMRIVKTKLGLS